jgi:hypothetical protein
MFRITKKAIRPNVDIQFFTEANPTSNTYKEYMHKHYIQTGKIIKVHNELSADRLTATQIMDWNSREDFLEFITDNVCEEELIAPSQLYNINNNIATEVHGEDI